SVSCAALLRDCLFPVRNWTEHLKQVINCLCIGGVPLSRKESGNEYQGARGHSGRHLVNCALTIVVQDLILAETASYLKHPAMRVAVESLPCAHLEVLKKICRIMRWVQGCRY